MRLWVQRRAVSGGDIQIKTSVADGGSLLGIWKGGWSQDKVIAQHRSWDQNSLLRSRKKAVLPELW